MDLKESITLCTLFHKRPGQLLHYCNTDNDNNTNICYIKIMSDVNLYRCIDKKSVNFLSTLTHDYHSFIWIQQSNTFWKSTKNTWHLPLRLLRYVCITPCRVNMLHTVEYLDRNPAWDSSIILLSLYQFVSLMVRRCTNRFTLGVDQWDDSILVWLWDGTLLRYWGSLQVHSTVQETVRCLVFC